MIEVNVTQTGLTVEGHAGYAKKGNDIICAGVSVLAQGLIRSLNCLTDDRISYQIRDGHIDIKYENLSEQGQLLVDSFFIAVSDIQLTYGGQYVRIGRSVDQDVRNVHKLCIRMPACKMKKKLFVIEV